MNVKLENKIAYVTYMLVAVNTLYFIYLEMASAGNHTLFMLNHGAMYSPYILENREYYRFLTSIFMHFDINHIMNNMLVFCVLGVYLERALGKIKYLILYLLCGVGSNLFSMYCNIQAHETPVSAGASGAVFGVIGGLLYAVAVNHGKLENISTRQLIILIGFSLYFGFASTGVDNIAHVSGLCFGIILSAILYRKPKPIL